jgi:hypothetical protein
VGCFRGLRNSNLNPALTASWVKWLATQAQTVERTKPEKSRLTSKARPATVGNKQALRVYEVMEELGGGPATTDEIVKLAEYRNYRYLLVTETSVERSIRWHLKGFVRKGWAEQV